MGSGQPRANAVLFGNGGPGDQIVDCPDAGRFEAVAVAVPPVPATGWLVAADGAILLTAEGEKVAESVKPESVLAACIRMGHRYRGRLETDDGVSAVEYRLE